MSEDKNEFFGKDVAEAIKNACESLGVAQEELDIEVIETGAAGIFGLIRKKAHIRAVIKPVQETQEDVFDVVPPPESHADGEETAADDEKKAEDSVALSTTAKDQDDSREDVKKETKKVEEVSGESLETVKSELLRIVELMGFPSTLDIEVN
ncbi:MAG: Jag N-terminal domain-containing protein, partial [Desulforhopalus sp.]